MRKLLARSILVSLVLAVFAAPVATAQDATPIAGEAEISVIGYGRATVAADSVLLRLVISDASYAGPEVFGSTEEELEAIAGTVDAIVGTGIAESDIQIIVGPTVSAYPGGYGGPARALLTFTMETPTNEAIDNVLEAANTAATEDRLAVSNVGTLYQVADCTAVVTEARQAAIADAQSQAIIQSDLLGLTLGPLVESYDLPTDTTDTAVYGYPGGESLCNAKDVAGTTTSFLFPLYSPSLEPAVTAIAQVQLSYQAN